MERLSPDELAETVKKLYEENGPLCDSEGFYNHHGECWNDALQMLFLNSDFCKEKVQAKLASEPIDPMKVEEKFSYDGEELFRNIPNNELYIRNYLGNVTTYLESLQKRFQRHYYAEHLRLSRARTDEVCTLEDFKGKEAIKELMKLSFLYRSKGKEGVLAGYSGQNIHRYNFDLTRDPRKFSLTYKPGGNEESRENVLRIFFLFFYPRFVKHIFRASSEHNNYFFDTGVYPRPFKFDKYILALYLGIYSMDNEWSHAVSFYTCGNRDFFYDDNVGSIQFPWHLFFKTYAENWKPDTKVSVLFDGSLKIKDKNNTILFSHPSYPFLIVRELKDTKVVGKEFITYLWDTTLISIDTMKINFEEYTFEKQIGDYTLIFTFGKPNVIMNTLVTIDWIETYKPVKGKQNEKSGIFLGARLEKENLKYKEALLEVQLKKVKEGKAKIDDFFYYDKQSDSEYTPLLYAIELNDFNYVKQVVDMKADIHKRGTLNASPFFSCFSNDGETDLKICKLLLEKGANINDNENFKGGYTPLMGSLLYHNGDDNLSHLQFLLENGADVHIKSKLQQATAIEFVMFRNNRWIETLDLLAKYGAVRPECPTADELLKKKEIYSAIYDRKYAKAGILARCYRKQEIYEELNRENLVGETPLKLALQLPEDLWTKELMEILLFNGARANYVDTFGMTPIFYAIQFGKKEFIQILLDFGAKIDVSAKGIGDVVTYAEKVGNPEIIEIIQTEKKRRPYTVAVPLKRKVKKSLFKNGKPNYTFKKRNKPKPKPTLIGGRKTRKY